MPRIDELIDRLGRAKVITTLDLTKGLASVLSSLLWLGASHVSFRISSGPLTCLPYTSPKGENPVDA